MSAATPDSTWNRAPTLTDRRQVMAVAVASLIVLAIALCLWRFVPSPTAPRINVRWTVSVPDEARLAIERHFSLLRGEAKEGRTWAYDLGDISRANVRALVAHPAIEDTHYLDRSAGTIAPTAPRGTLRIGGPLSTVRESAVLTWTLTAAATTTAVCALWLASTGRRTGAR
jgi:hypothetical protein